MDGQAIEPAVQYVQKIKQRCDPETYRQFLDILSKYHSKPDSIDEVIQSFNPYRRQRTLTCFQEEVSKQIARLFKERGMAMAAISGTFNLCDPDTARLQDNLRRLDVLAAACRWLDTRIITLCTGTLDP